jgi:hypothetical protein
VISARFSFVPTALNHIYDVASIVLGTAIALKNPASPKPSLASNMARSIWTQEERDLLVPYVAQYKSGDEDSRILLLEHKVIPKFLAKFPPRLAESDADEAGNHEGDLREVKRHTKQVCCQI